MALPEEKLSELDEALAELGKDDDEISAVLRGFEGGDRADLTAVDAELDDLSEGADIVVAASKPLPAAAASLDAGQDDWDGEHTEIEIMDSADDFVLLVDEDDLEELERAADDAPRVTVPPPLPGETRAQGEEGEGDEEDEGFFKKLFGSRRNSNRP